MEVFAPIGQIGREIEEQEGRIDQGETAPF